MIYSNLYIKTYLHLQVIYKKVLCCFQVAVVNIYLVKDRNSNQLNMSFALISLSTLVQKSIS